MTDEPLGAALSAIAPELADVIATANHREATPGDAAVAVLVVVERALREAGAVVPVTCGLCRFWQDGVWCEMHGFGTGKDYYCADGERRD